MPELPDLHLYAKNLRKFILGKTIAQAEANPYKVSATPAVFREALRGKTVDAVDRNGKELFFTLSGGQVFSVHLMLHGRFSILAWDAVPSAQHKVLALRFEGDEALAVTDYSGMCKATLSPAWPAVPDALSERFTYEYFVKTIHRHAGKGIKAFLINQQAIRGIGNAYVDEILWKADISPKSIAGKIPEKDLRGLYDAVGWVLRDAIEQLERICPDAISGEERSFLRVHNHKKARTEEGDVILREYIDKKQTYYTRRQRVFL
ncbi:MAG: Fpg/Nei family DNA glycosylase [Firmicutes bacterium]|nr:Fpg/Nei family DNA glycosylase [Bacillota bacterium]